MGPFPRILVPTDFSLASEDAVVRARELAELSPDTTVTLLYVLVAGPFAPVKKDPQSGANVIEAPIRATIESELDRIREEHLDGFDRVETAVTVARNAAIGIVTWAAEHDQSLVVMTKRGRGGLATQLIGGTTEKVVRLARCTVMTFKSQTLEASEDDGR